MKSAKEVLQKRLLRNSQPKRKDPVFEAVMESVESGGVMAQFLDFVGVVSRGLEIGFSIADKIFKPLELVTNALSLLRNFSTRSALDRAADPKEYARKKRKKDVLALFGTVAVGLGFGVLFASGVGAVALIAAGYVVAGVKSFYLNRETGKKIKTFQEKQKERAQKIVEILQKEKPTREDFLYLSEESRNYLEKHAEIKEKKEKRKDRSIDMAFTVLTTIAFVAAAAFPPLLLPMGAVGVGLIALGAGRNLVNWAKKKFPRIFSFGSKSKDETDDQKKSHQKAKDKKYKILNEMVASVTSTSSQSSQSSGSSFTEMANGMLHRYEVACALEKRAREAEEKEAAARSAHESALEESQHQLEALERELETSALAVNAAARRAQASFENIRAASREQEMIESRVISEAQLLGMGPKEFVEKYSDPNHEDFSKYQPLLREFSNAFIKVDQAREENRVANLELREKQDRQFGLDEACFLLRSEIENASRNLSRAAASEGHSVHEGVESFSHHEGSTVDSSPPSMGLMGRFPHAEINPLGTILGLHVFDHRDPAAKSGEETEGQAAGS